MKKLTSVENNGVSLDVSDNYGGSVNFLVSPMYISHDDNKGKTVLWVSMKKQSEDMDFEVRIDKISWNKIKQNIDRHFRNKK